MQKALWLLAVCWLLAAAHEARGQSTFPQVNVGSKSSQVAVTVTVANGGTVKSVQVLTAGAAGLDFAPVDDSSTCKNFVNQTVMAHQTCTEQVTFTPTVPGVRSGAVVLLDGSGNALGTTYISGIGLGGLAVLTPGQLQTVAGQDYQSSNIPDQGVTDLIPATQAFLTLPTSVALDGAGNLLIADSQHHRVRVVCSTTPPPLSFLSNCAQGDIATIAGNGTAGYSGDGGPATSASLNTPGGVAVDGAGNIYIADTGNNVIRVIAANSGIISTFTGTANSSQKYGGDNGLYTGGVYLNQPWGVTIDSFGNVYIADTGNNLIRCANLSTGLMTTVAGTPPSGNGNGGYSGDGGPAISAELSAPYAVAFDAAGNLYIPDAGNNRIRKVSADQNTGRITTQSTITTFAGSGATDSVSCTDPPVQALSASLNEPAGVAVDAAGNVYISDTHHSAIREVNSSGMMLNLAITTCLSPLLNGANPSFSVALNNASTLYQPLGIALDGKGNLFIADYYDQIVSEIQGNSQVIDFTKFSPLSPVVVGSESPSIFQNLDNDGNAPLDLSSITPGINTALGTGASNACAIAPTTLAAGEECSLAVIYAPQATSSSNPNSASGEISIVDDAQNSPILLQVIGTPITPNPTTTSVTSNSSTSNYGVSVAFTATVSNGNLTPAPTGRVNFLDYGSVIGTVTLGANLEAVFTTATLLPGSHSITAEYLGDTYNTSSLSAPYLFTVNPAITQTTVTITPNPSVVTQAVTMKAVVSGSGGNPSGTITFLNGTSVLGTGKLSDGSATFSTSALAVGTYSISAVYSGDTNDASSTSSPGSLVVNAIPTVTTLDSTTSNTQIGQVLLIANVVNTTTGPAPTGTVTFSNGGTVLGVATLDAADIATLVPNFQNGANYTILASYGGDANHAPSTAQSINVTGSTQNFSISLTPPSVSLATKQNTTVTVNFSSYNSYTDTLNLGCAGLPASMTCRFSPTSVTLPSNGAVSSQLTIDTNNPLGGGSTAMNRLPGAGRALWAGFFLPAGLVFGFAFWRRRRLVSYWSVGLLLVLSAGALFVTGCGNSMSVSSVAPGSYTIDVTATGVNSNVIHYQTIVVKVTQ